eukprot:CAMPEP_0174346992 /NCGR_PEP_ID=MMETSP0811_2-20130205/2921_1 /TAXON_ID=73025 ORGANISM="Eutreptiella gymnastica-like, Strain CCMP1594" /NCGR_SAMPLE_ID=MMETSP0811_2 /ASSEMBLY_ACC=CAM_ASM_000667 /LENGTH=72 /DNA_ID=CAMNT_0015472129 /DNA_START=17 /DNA_END=235 /DNA_ORIENTATION=-
MRGGGYMVWGTSPASLGFRLLQDRTESDAERTGNTPASSEGGQQHGTTPDPHYLQLSGQGNGTEGQEQFSSI